MDAAITEAVRATAAYLAEIAESVGVAKIGERSHLHPALRQKLTDLLGRAVDVSEPRLSFAHWQGLPGKRLGGIDVAVRSDDHSGYRAFIELKWGTPDWMILDFYKMTTGRVSPGADSCYVVAGQRKSDWQREGSVCELFRGRRWRTGDVLRRHYRAFRGDEREYGKLTSLPHFIEATLVADQPLTAPLEAWAIKAVRVEPAPPDDTVWHTIKNGEIV